MFDNKYMENNRYFNEGRRMEKLFAAASAVKRCEKLQPCVFSMSAQDIFDILDAATPGRYTEPESAISYFVNRSAITN